MSIDTYFCFCCLSTDDLHTLYGSEENYGVLLSELFSVEPFQEDYEDDGYICSKCASTIKEFDQFRKQIKANVSILQSNGLILTETKNNQIIVRKATSVNIEDNTNCDLDENDVSSNEEEIKQNDTESPPKQKRMKIKGMSIIKEYLKTTESKINTYIPKTKEKSKEEKKEIKTKEIGKEEKKVVKTKEIGKEEKKVNQDLECKECFKKMPSLYMYHRHMNTHFPNFICDVCGNGFVTQRKLKRHKATHNVGPFICDVCNMEFKYYNTLNSHRQRKHRPNGIKKYKKQEEGNNECTVCGKIYALSGSLYTHMRMKHKNEKRYFCHLCPDAFYHKQDLVAHEYTHTRSKLFKCSQCDKSYRYKKSLTVHMRAHTNDRRFICDFCGRKYIQKVGLVLHMKLHYIVKKS